MYIIRLGEFLPPSEKTTARYNYYQKHPVIKAHKLPITFIDQLMKQKITINASHIKYDARKKYIQVKSYTRDELHQFRKESNVI